MGPAVGVGFCLQRGPSKAVVLNLLQFFTYFRCQPNDVFKRFSILPALRLQKQQFGHPPPTHAHLLTKHCCHRPSGARAMKVTLWYRVVQCPIGVLLGDGGGKAPKAFNRSPTRANSRLIGGPLKEPVGPPVASAWPSPAHAHGLGGDVQTVVFAIWGWEDRTT